MCAACSGQKRCVDVKQGLWLHRLTMNNTSEVLDAVSSPQEKVLLQCRGLRLSRLSSDSWSSYLCMLQEPACDPTLQWLPGDDDRTLMPVSVTLVGPGAQVLINTLVYLQLLDSGRT